MSKNNCEQCIYGSLRSVDGEKFLWCIQQRGNCLDVPKDCWSFISRGLIANVIFEGQDKGGASNDRP